jgi:hypothetical protein
MKVRSIKLVDGGRAGAIVDYDSNKEVNKLTFSDPVNETCKAPVPQNIRDKVQGFKLFIMDVCGYWVSKYDEYVDFATMEILKPNKGDNTYFEFRDILDRLELTKISYDGLGLTLEAKYRTDINRKVITLKTPVIKPVNDEIYEHYELACLMAKELFSLVKGYVEGDIKLEPRQMTIEDLESKGKDANEIKAIIEGMDEDDFMEYATDWLAGKGSIVIGLDDVLEGTETQGEGTQEEEVEDITPLEATNEMEPVEMEDEAKIVPMNPEVKAEEADEEEVVDLSQVEGF